MAENAGTRFFEGMRVTADHLRHMQDRLWEAVGDLRLALGRGRIAWGLQVAPQGAQVRVSPGVAFSPEGVRLALDTDTDLDLPAGAGPFVVRLVPVNEDRASLQMGGVPTYVTLRAEVQILDQAAAGPAAPGLDIATVDAGPEVQQSPDLFAASGHHSHSGGFVQDDTGNWHFDGPEIAGLAPLAASVAALETATAGLPGQVAALETALGPLPGQIGALEAVVAPLPGQVAAVETELGPLPGQVAAVEAAIATLPGRLDALETALDDLAARLAALEAAGGSGGGTGGIDIRALAATVAALQPLVAEVATLTALAGIATDLQGVPALARQVSRLDRALTALDARVAALEAQGGTGGGTVWAELSGSNWPHGQTLPLDMAVRILSQVDLKFTEQLADPQRSSGMDAIQVWFEPGQIRDPALPPQPVISVQGKTGFGGADINWSAITDPAILMSAFKDGGRLMLRLHCGALATPDGRVLAASLTALTDIKMPPIPGGVLETWFMVQGG